MLSGDTAVVYSVFGVDPHEGVGDAPALQEQSDQVRDATFHLSNALGELEGGSERSLKRNIRMDLLTFLHENNHSFIPRVTSNYDHRKALVSFTEPFVEPLDKQSTFHM